VKVIAPAMELARTIRNDAIRACGARMSLSLATRDPGLDAVFWRQGVKRMHPQDTRPVLTEFKRLNELANELAGKIAQAEAWIREAEEHIASGQDVSTVLQEKLRQRKPLVASWIESLTELESKQVECWRHYLSAFPDGRLLLQANDGSGKQVVFSLRPIANAKYPVWTPREICVALRVGYALGTDLTRQELYADPTLFVATYCEKDPVSAAVLTAKQKAALREKAGIIDTQLTGSLFGAGKTQEGSGFGRL
jgi:hypothetical protein